MMLDLDKFKAYVQDEQKTLPRNPSYDGIMMQLLAGNTVEFMDWGVAKYLVIDQGKITVITRTGNA